MNWKPTRYVVILTMKSSNGKKLEAEKCGIVTQLAQPAVCQSMYKCKFVRDAL